MNLQRVYSLIKKYDGSDKSLCLMQTSKFETFI